MSLASMGMARSSRFILEDGNCAISTVSIANHFPIPFLGSDSSTVSQEATRVTNSVPTYCSLDLL